jgi:hypothetical protein
MSEPIWLVEVGEYEQAYVAHAFTTEALAEQYAAANDGHAYEVELRDQPVGKVPYYHAGAEVFPDGEVRRWFEEHEEDAPGMEAVDKADRLHGRDDPWDGHSQGHCGFHVSVFGADAGLVKQAREEWVEHYLPMCDGRCRGCGKTEKYTRNFEPDTETIVVHYVGGPHAGETEDVEAPIYGSLGLRPPINGLLVMHGTLPDGMNQSWYGPIKWDEETSRWVRVCSSTKPIETVRP